MSHLALWYCPKDTDDASRQHNLLLTISYPSCHSSNRHGVGASLNYLERHIPNKSGKFVGFPKVKVKRTVFGTKEINHNIFFKCAGEWTIAICESFNIGLILKRLVDLDKDLCVAEGWQKPHGGGTGIMNLSQKPVVVSVCHKTNIKVVNCTSFPLFESTFPSFCIM